MITEFRQKSTYILNNENGDIPIALIGFIFIGLLVIGVSLRFKDRIGQFFQRAGQTVDSWDTTSANGTP